MFPLPKNKAIAATTAAYDFWNSPYFQPDDIRKAHVKSTVARIKEHDLVLMIQDTTSIDLTSHKATNGLGYLDQAPLGRGCRFGVWGCSLLESPNNHQFHLPRQFTGVAKGHYHLPRPMPSSLYPTPYPLYPISDLRCDRVLQACEWQRQSPQVGKPAHGAGSSLCATINKNPIPPQQPPSLPEAVRMIATLGGFLGRKGDGELGVKTIWRSRTVSKRGLRRLHDITATWKLVDQIS